MKADIRKKQRLVRVRRVQHLQAAAVAAQADARVATLEGNAARLTSLHDSLSPAAGFTTASSLSRNGELAMRLDAARVGLTDAIATARVSADRLGALRLEARIREESAEKLKARAAAAYEHWRERKATPAARRRAAGETDA